MAAHPGNSVPNETLFGGLQVREYLNLLRRHRWLIAISTVSIFTIVFVIAMTLPNVYRAETVILVEPQRVSASLVGNTATPNISARLALIRDQVLAQARLKKLIDSMQLYPDMRGQSDQAVINRMRNAIEVDTVKQTGFPINAFSIAYHGADAAVVAQVANQLAAQFIEENLKSREQELYGTSEFLDAELEKTRKQIEDKENELKTMKDRYLGAVPQSQQYEVEQLNSLRSQLQGLQDRVDRDQQQKAYLQSLMTTTAPTVDLDSTSVYETQVEKLTAQLGQLTTRYGPMHPEVRKVEAELAEARKAAAAEQKNSVPPQMRSSTVHNPVLEAQIQQLDKQIQDATKAEPQIQQQINVHLANLRKIPAFDERVADVMRDYDTLRAHYTELLNKRLSADTATAMETRQKAERFVILNPAQVPEKPYGPKRLLLALAGLVAGLAGGIGAAIAAEITSESVRSEHEAARIADKPVLATIPVILSPVQIRRQKIKNYALLATSIVASTGVGFVISVVTRRVI